MLSRNFAGGSRVVRGCFRDFLAASGCVTLWCCAEADFHKILGLPVRHVSKVSVRDRSAGAAWEGFGDTVGRALKWVSCGDFLACPAAGWRVVVWTGDAQGGAGVFMCGLAWTCDLPVCAIKLPHPSVPHGCGKVGAKAGVNVG